jgi:nitroreductase/SAM-dependent methyltransferase
MKRKNSIYDIIKGRRSIRKFLPKPVPKEVILKLIEAASWAPSACNRQLWQFVVIENEYLKTKLKDVSPLILRINPPVVIYILYNKNYNPEHHANVQSAAAAIQNLLLAAYSEGLGSLWMCETGKEENIKRALNIPEEYMVIAAVCLGYSDEKIKPPPRRPLKEIVHFGPMTEVKSFPRSMDPQKWSLVQIRDYVNYSIRAKSALPQFYQPKQKLEFKTEISCFPKLNGKTLFFYPDAGNYLFELSSKNLLDDAYVYCISQESVNFLETKRRNIGMKKEFKYFVGLDKIPFKNNFFDSIVCAKKLECCPEPEKFIKEFKRVLKKDGKLYLLSNNGLSIYFILTRFYYLIFSYLKFDIVNAFGPSKPFSIFKIEKLLEDFKIEKFEGIDLLPGVKLRGPPFYGRNILPQSKLESYKTRGFLKYFCKSLFFICSKKEDGKNKK